MPPTFSPESRGAGFSDDSRLGGVAARAILGEELDPALLLLAADETPGLAEVDGLAGGRCIGRRRRGTPMPGGDGSTDGRRTADASVLATTRGTWRSTFLAKVASMQAASSST